MSLSVILFFAFVALLAAAPGALAARARPAAAPRPHRFPSLAALYDIGDAAPAPWVAAVERPAARAEASAAATAVKARWNAGAQFAPTPEANATSGAALAVHDPTAAAGSVHAASAAVLATSSTPPSLDLSTIAMLQVTESMSHASEINMQLAMEGIVEPLAVLGIPALVAIFIMLLRKLSFTLIASMFKPGLLDPTIDPVVEILAPLPRTGGLNAGMFPIDYKGSSGTGGQYKEPVMGDPGSVDDLAQSGPAQTPNQLENNAFPGGGTGGGGGAGGPGGPGNGSDDDSGEDVSRNSVTTNKRRYIPPSQFMTDSSLWSRLDRERTGIATLALLSADIQSMAEWAELAQPHLWPGFAGSIDPRDAATRVLTAVQTTGRPGMTKPEWARDKYGIFTEMRTRGARYASERREKLLIDPLLGKDWPLMTLPDFRHMQNDWQLLPLVLWKLINAAQDNAVKVPALEGALRDLWSRPDPALLDPSMKLPNAEPLPTTKLSLTGPDGFQFGRVYQACIVRVARKTAVRLHDAYQSPDLPFPGVYQAYFIRNFQEFIHEAYRVKRMCAQKQAMAGLGLAMPGGIGAVVNKDAAEDELWRRYVASPKWVAKRNDEVRGNKGTHGLPASMAPAAASGLVSATDAEATKMLSWAQIAAALTLEAEPDATTMRALTAAQGAVLWNCTRDEADATYGKKAVSLYSGAKAARGAVIERPQFALNVHGVATLGKALQQTCMARALAANGLNDQEIFILWDVYSAGADSDTGFISKERVQASMMRLVKRAAEKPSPLAKPAHTAVRKCLERHVPGAAAKAMKDILPLQTDKIAGAKYRASDWLKPTPPQSRANNGYPISTDERVVFTELGATVSARARADEDADVAASAEAEVEAEAETAMDAEDTGGNGEDADADEYLSAPYDPEAETEREVRAMAEAGVLAETGAEVLYEVAAQMESPQTDAMFARGRAKLLKERRKSTKRMMEAARKGLGAGRANYWQFYRGARGFKGTVESIALLCTAPYMPAPPPPNMCPSKSVARPNEDQNDRDRRIDAARKELRASFTRFDPQGTGALSLQSFSKMFVSAAFAAVNNPKLFPQVAAKNSGFGSKETRIIQGCLKEKAKTIGRTLFARYLRLHNPLALPLDSKTVTEKGKVIDPLAKRELTFGPLRQEPMWFRHQICAIVNDCVKGLGGKDDGPSTSVRVILHTLWMRTLRIIADIHRANARVIATKLARERYAAAAKELLGILAPEFLVQRASVVLRSERNARGLLTTQWFVSNNFIARRHPGAISAAAAALAEGGILDTYRIRRRMARYWTSYDPRLTYKIDEMSRMEAILHSKLDVICTQRVKAGEDGFDIAKDQACQCARQRVPAAAVQLKRFLDKDDKGYVSAEDYFLTFTEPDVFEVKASTLLQACAQRMARTSEDIAAEYASMYPLTPRNIEMNWERRIRSMICSEPGWPHIARCMLPRAAKDSLAAALDLVSKDPSGKSKVFSTGEKGGQGVTITKEAFSAHPYLLRDAFAALMLECRETTEVRAGMAHDDIVWRKFSETREIVIAPDVERVICQRLAGMVGVHDAVAPSSFLALNERIRTVPDSVVFLESGADLSAVVTSATAAGADSGSSEGSWLVRDRTQSPAMRAVAACVSRSAHDTARRAIARVDTSIHGERRGRIRDREQLTSGDGRVTRCEFDASPTALDDAIDELFAKCGAKAGDDAARVLASYAELDENPLDVRVSSIALEERYTELIESARRAAVKRKVDAVELYQKSLYSKSHASADGRATPALKEDAHMQALALTQFEAVAECALDITGKAARQVIEGMILHVEGVDAVLEASFAESGSETDAQASAYVVSLAEAVGVDTQSPTFIEALSRRRSARNNAGRAAHGHKVLSIGAKHVQQLPYALASGAKSVMQRCELATHSRIHRLWSRYAPIKSTYESKMELREMASGADGGRGEFSWLAEAERALDAADADLKGKGSVDPDYDPDEKRLDFIPRQVVEEMLQRMITVASKRRVDHDEDDAVLAAARRERAKQGSLLETDADADKRASDANVPGFSLFSRCVRQGIPLATDRVVAFFLRRGELWDENQTPPIRPGFVTPPFGGQGRARESVLPEDNAQRLLKRAAQEGKIWYRDWLRRQLGPLHIPLDPPHPWGRSCPAVGAIFGSNPRLTAAEATSDLNDILASAVFAAAQQLAHECDDKVHWPSLFNEIIYRTLEPVVGGAVDTPGTTHFKPDAQAVADRPLIGADHPGTLYRTVSPIHTLVPPEPAELVTGPVPWVHVDPIRGAGVDAAVDAQIAMAAKPASLLSVHEVRAAGLDRSASAALLGLAVSPKARAAEAAVFAEMGVSVGADPGLEAIENDYGPLVARVSKILGDSAASGLAAGLQASLPENMVKVTNNTVSRVTARKLLKTLTISLTDSLTAILLLAISRPLVHHMTRMIAHALTPAIMYPATSIIARALTHNPREDYYCWYCATTGKHESAPGISGVPLYCEYCQRSQEYMYNIDYYAQYFARHYTAYYAEFYSQGADMDQMIKMREPAIERIMAKIEIDSVDTKRALYGPDYATYLAEIKADAAKAGPPQVKS